MMAKNGEQYKTNGITSRAVHIDYCANCANLKAKLIQANLDIIRQAKRIEELEIEIEDKNESHPII